MSFTIQTKQDWSEFHLEMDKKPIFKTVAFVFVLFDLNTP